MDIQQWRHEYHQMWAPPLLAQNLTTSACTVHLITRSML